MIWGFEGYVGRKWGETTAPLKEQRGSPLSEGIYVANDNDDQPVLSHIDRLVKEEEHLYGKSELTEEDRRRLADLLSRSMGHRTGQDVRSALSVLRAPWNPRYSECCPWIGDGERITSP